jgi:hypothetical protein
VGYEADIDIGDGAAEPPLVAAHIPFVNAKESLIDQPMFPRGTENAVPTPVGCHIRYRTNARWSTTLVSLFETSATGKPGPSSRTVLLGFCCGGTGSGLAVSSHGELGGGTQFTVGTPGPVWVTVAAVTTCVHEGAPAKLAGGLTVAPSANSVDKTLPSMTAGKGSAGRTVMEGATTVNTTDAGGAPGAV